MDNDDGTKPSQPASPSRRSFLTGAAGVGVAAVGVGGAVFAVREAKRRSLLVATERMSMMRGWGLRLRLSLLALLLLTASLGIMHSLVGGMSVSRSNRRDPRTR